VTIWILAHPGEDEPCAGSSRQALGRTVAGRYLRVVYVPDEAGDGVFVVTAPANLLPEIRRLLASHKTAC